MRHLRQFRIEYPEVRQRIVVCLEPRIRLADDERIADWLTSL
ncbi:MAG TPA: hypothetical protein PKE26_06075 [Kiritimatiellia bacterium]|nr:hypothetical protein [Kiritimatiellia bacterium]HMO98661.1 hypothetical protein [Kiritimatiellia bacterium]